jgi:IS30 family transposase
MPRTTGNRGLAITSRRCASKARDRNISTAEIAKNLGRTVNAVRAEAQRKSISLRPKNR